MVSDYHGGEVDRDRGLLPVVLGLVRETRLELPTLWLGSYLALSAVGLKSDRRSGPAGSY